MRILLDPRSKTKDPSDGRDLGPETQDHEVRPETQHLGPIS